MRIALDENPAARSSWDRLPRRARKMMLWWVISAARDETRARRIDAIVDTSAIGERARR